MTDVKRDDWEFNSIRKSIDLDWATLASEDLSSEKRKRLTEHLMMNVRALQDLVARNRSASHKSKLERQSRLTNHNSGGAV
jgi:hypothetical protein